MSTARQVGWALQPDGLAHHFDGVAYPACQKWMDWGTERGPIVDRPCLRCITALRDRLRVLEDHPNRDEAALYIKKVKATLEWRTP